MPHLEVLGDCAQGLEESSLVEEEEEMITFKFVIAICGSFLPFEVEVKKPLMDDCVDELEDLEVLEEI